MKNISFSIGGVFYLIILLVLIFVKKVDRRLENKIYIALVITTLLGTLLDVCTFIMSLNGTLIELPLYTNITKMILSYYELWSLLFSLYVIAVSKRKNNKSGFRKYIIFFLLFVFPIFIFLNFCTKLNFYDDRNLLYPVGTSVTICYLHAFCMVLFLFVYLIRNKDNIFTKEYIPLWLLIIFIGAAVFIQLLVPGLILITYAQSLLTFIMYFTIENPDMKMIEQLNIARDQADKANQAKSDFLSSMSHEIRTPLNAIVGFSEALQEENLPDKAQEEVKDIVMASNSLLEIVNGILDISKIESGKIEIVNSEYNFRELYDNLVTLTKGRLGEKPLEVRTSYDESIPKVLYGDHTRVKQIILNILTNAVKYTKEGYIEFKVTSLVKDDICRLIISVEDSGIGIKNENIDKLFSRFERLDIDKNITIEGTGLGLAITKKLIELMHGTIVVQSIYGKGSKFTIAIDQRIIHKEVVEEKKEVVDTTKNINVAGKKVLIVDDNKINLKVASRLLEGYNLEIDTVDSGTLCLDKINSGCSYDLILMDDMMPGLSGVDTLHKLKENTSFNIPVVALTANAISGMKEKYLSEGFNDYLAKPIDKEELKSIIIKYLNN